MMNHERIELTDGTSGVIVRRLSISWTVRPLNCGESGHAFHIIVFAVFPSYGHLDQQVHQRLDISKANGAGREWFTVSSEQDIKAIRWVIGQTDREAHGAGGELQ